MPRYYAHAPTGRPANADLTIDSARYRDTDVAHCCPFGHGLSYARFVYSDLAVTPRRANAGETFRISLDVKNDSGVASDEVVQLYIRAPVSGMARPVKELRGFQRLQLAPGQKKRLTFELPAGTGAVWNGSAFETHFGQIDIMVGASSEDIRARATVTVTHIRGQTDPIAPAARPTRVTTT